MTQSQGAGEPPAFTLGDHDELLPGAFASSFDIETIVELQKAKWYHAAFHTVCAVVGAGVLGLPYALSYLGWVFGLVMLTLLCAASLYTSHLLAQLHEDPDSGRRHATYRDIGEAVWPRYGRPVIEGVQFTLMVGLCITYSVTAGQSLKGTASADCDGADCEGGLAPWIVLFGAAQLALSQVPDFHSLWWVSLLGAAMSCGYCGIAAGASAAAALSGDAAPPPAQREGESSADRAFGVLNALGSIAFTFGGQAVLPEIQATLARPPKTYGSMMRGIGAAYVVVVVAYYAVAIAGYAAFGAAVRPDVLLSISHPKALVDAANVMVVVHVAAGYQIFAMPLFEFFEGAARARLRPPPRPLALRLTLRSAFVVGTTLVACMLPFFGDLMGLIASVGLMPITFILPPLLWVSARRPRGAERALCLGIAGATSVLAALAFVGSMRNIIVDAKRYDFLGRR